uniref:Major sperm protein n=1 Tax=Trichuris muris TaxID=70415 RepID=A0A5S6QAP2_TRIMR
MLSTYLTNDGQKRIAVKIRTTDNNIFRVNKVYFLLAPGEKAELQLHLLPLGLQFNFLCRNRITIIYGPVSKHVKLAKHAWKHLKTTDQFSVRVTIAKPRKGDPVAKEIIAAGAKEHFDGSLPSMRKSTDLGASEAVREASVKDMVTVTSIFNDHLEPRQKDQNANTLETLPGAATVKPGLPETVKPEDKIFHTEDITLKTAELIDDKLTEFEPVRTEKHVDDPILLTDESANAGSSEAKREASVKDMVTVASIWDDHSESSGHGEMRNTLDSASAAAGKTNLSEAVKPQHSPFCNEDINLKTAELIDDKVTEFLC